MASGIINIPYAKYGTQFVTLWTSIDNFSINATTSLGTSFSIEKTGYVFIGLVGHSITNASNSGANRTFINVHKCIVSDNTVSFGFRNTSSNAAKIKISVAGLYLKV